MQKPRLRLKQALIAVLLCGLSQTSMADAPQDPKHDPGFSLQLYRQLASVEKGNVACSPFSLSAALAMVYCGSRTQTSTEFESVAGFSASSVQSLGAACQEYNQVQPTGSLQITNFVWPSFRFKIQQDYTKMLSQTFASRVQPLDFSTDAARATINKQVAAATQNLILQLIPAGVLDSSTDLVLTNTIYLKCKWDKPFDPNATRPARFHSGKSSRPCNLMHQLDNFGYYEDSKVQVAQLPYAGKRFEMLVVLPRPEVDLRKIERDLDSKTYQTWVQELSHEKLSLSLPRFKVASNLSLERPLMELGLRRIFSSTEADLSGIATGKGLHVSRVLQQAVIKADEMGTTAAAATAVAMTRGMSKITPFVADRPFLFAIRDSHNGQILFLGRVEQPDAAVD